MFEFKRPEDFGIVSREARNYAAPKDERFNIEVIRTRSDAGAYALLMREVAANQQKSKLDAIGTAAYALQGRVLFFKGTAFVSVSGQNKEAGEAANLARALADTLDKGENEIPVLVKHLPEWEVAQDRAAYAVSRPALQEAAGQRPILDALSFEGGAEAVTAVYG
ncbi:MAG: hypothetical protein LC731_08765, partial [Acidobacteria bacterium]|nr:hypothetical protein [Acidobacteriota bacterium]